MGTRVRLTAVEAMACARPVVATDAGGLRHLVPDEGGARSRRATQPRSQPPCARCWPIPALGRAMGEHNRRVVEERYAWSRVVDRLEDALPRGDPRAARGASRAAARRR